MTDISVAGMTELPPGTDHAVLVASVMAAVRGFSGYRGVPHLKVNWVGRFVNGGPHANKVIRRPPSYVALWQQRLAEASEDEDEDEDEAGADVAGESEELCWDGADEPPAIEDAQSEELGMEEEGMEEQGMAEEEHVDAVADYEAGSSLAVQDVAEEEQVDAEADAEAGWDLAEQGMAEEEQVLTLAHETGPPTTRTRKRDSSLCVGLPDTHKAAHKNRCAVEMRKQVFAVGNAVQARWGGAKGKAWYAGTVTGVSELSAEQGGPAWTYDIAYNDGDRSQGLKAQYVRA